MIYPSHFEEKIGFTGMRRLLEDACQTPMGLEYIREIAFSANPGLIVQSLDEALSFVALIESGHPLNLRDVSDLRDELDRIRVQGTVIEQEALFDMKTSLRVLVPFLRFLRSEPSEVFLPVLAMCEGIELPPALVKELERLTDDKGEIPDHASPQLSEIRQEIRRKHGSVERRIRQMLGEAKQQGWADSEVEITIRNGRMVIPVKVSDKRRLRGFIHDESSSGQTVYIEPAEIFDTNNEIRELEYAEKREINRILAAFTTFVRPYLILLQDVWILYGRLDATQAKARLSLKIGGVSTRVEPQPVIDWIQAIHPLLYLTLREQKKTIVPLDINLNRDQRILVISGPNAGGKSVCLKTIGLLQYMVQCGLPVPMKQNSVCGIFENIFIDIGDEQSLENDLSTYSSHLINMKFFIGHASPSTLFLIDEFGTGTEPQLGGAIAEAVLESLNQRQAFGVVTTHYANLKLMADRNPGIINGAMLFDTAKLQPLYLLQTGRPGSSFAFEIARKIGFPEDVLSQAAGITGQSQLNFDMQLQQLEVEKKEVARKQTELRLADILLNEVIEKYKRLLRQLEERRKTLLSEAGREAQTLIDKANRQIELTIKEIRESQAEKEKTKQLREALQESKTVLAGQTDELVKQPLAVEEQKEEILGDLKPGDMVSIDELEVSGELLSISEHEAVISFQSVKLRTSPEKLRKLSGQEKRKTIVKNRSSARQSIMDDINEKSSQFKLTIDVRGKRAEETIELVEKYIDEAMLISMKEVSILHGKGNGILRRVVREYLSKQKMVASFEDAPVEAGGTGITRVRIK
jgi:DNA mismatch repair protein MutS2